MAEGVADERLRTAFEQHAAETEEQARRLEQVFQEIGQEPTDEKCEAMAGLIKEGNELLDQEDADEAVKDAAIIGAAQKVEHYEIAGYGTAAGLARHLGLGAAVQLLEQTLEEEEMTDEKLTRIAEQIVNPRATRMAGSGAGR
jgi:ferritin-like metal-binding protein YciE